MHDEEYSKKISEKQVVESREGEDFYFLQFVPLDTILFIQFLYF